MKKWMFSLLMIASSLSAFQPTVDPDSALKKLLEGNERFINDKSICPKRSEERRLDVSSKQTPFAAVVACSDSRVSPDVIYDQGVGDLFVVRVAGNVVSDIELDSVEYAVLHLNASLVVVMGHANCGAVTAVLTGNAHSIESIARIIQPSIKSISPNGKDSLERAIKANILTGVNTIKNSPQLKDLLDQKKIQVLGGYYHLETGKVELLKFEG